MFELVGNRNAEIAAWATKEYGLEFGTPYTAIGVVKEGKIIGAAFLNDYADGNIELTYVGPGSISRRLICAVAETAFQINGCDRLSATTLATNERAIRALEKVGFVLEGRKRMPEGKPDRLIFGMLKSECRFLRKN